MEVVRKYTLEKLHFPVDGYTHIVKLITSVDGGQNFYYCGNSRYFRTEKEARDYQTMKERENERGLC